MCPHEQAWTYAVWIQQPLIFRLQDLAYVPPLGAPESQRSRAGWLHRLTSPPGPPNPNPWCYMPERARAMTPRRGLPVRLLLKRPRAPQRDFCWAWLSYMKSQDSREQPI